MPSKGLFGGLKAIDAFGKTMEDVKVRTRTGAFLTLLSVAIILSFTTMEFLDYRRVGIDTSVVVDRSRGEKLTVHLNVTFPRVPCYLMSLDLMDISGEVQRDISHDIIKTRLTAAGTAVAGAQVGELRNDIDRLNEQRMDGYCGSCYGGEPPEGGCCNSCDAVREAYTRRGWSFGNPGGIDQCVEEHWSDHIQEQSSEGCNVAGLVRVNKVIGNIHLSPGRSFQTAQSRIYELVPYLKNDGNRHDFSHTVHHMYFTADDEADESKAQVSREMRERLGIYQNPLDGNTGRTSKAQYMFHYFLKVVSTQYRTLDGQLVNSHQYSVTHFERDLETGSGGNTAEGLQIQHGVNGLPGVFFSYEISPILVAHRETRQSFAHFLTSTCAIVGGVLTVASILDSALFATQRSLKRNAGANGHPNGKLM
jgi:hypothetical protein